MRVKEQKKRPASMGNRSNRLKARLHGKSFVIPSLVTMVAIFSGFLAIISAIRGDYVYAVRCVLIAIILDGLDGRIARRLNATSAFGREFDSLSDVVSFGVAPAVLLYTWGFAAVADEFGVLISFIIVVCAATRLARFNVIAAAEDSTYGFSGLPSPGAAAALVCLVFLFPEPLTEPVYVFFAMVFSTCIALLMVSTFPFLSVKRITFSSKQAPLLVVALAFTVAFAWKFTAITMFTLSIAYAASGPVLWMVKRNRSKETISEKEAPLGETKSSSSESSDSQSSTQTH